MVPPIYTPIHDHLQRRANCAKGVNKPNRPEKALLAVPQNQLFKRRVHLRFFIPYRQTELTNGKQENDRASSTEKLCLASHPRRLFHVCYIAVLIDRNKPKPKKTSKTDRAPEHQC